MAMTEEQRRVQKEVREILDSYGKARFKADVPVNEDVQQKKMINLNDIGKYLDNVQLAYNGTNKFDKEPGVVSVALYLMSTQWSDGEYKVKVDENKNLINIGIVDDEWHNRNYEDKRYDVVISENTHTEAKNFIELPTKSESDSTLTASSIVALCDANRIFDIYLQDALAIVRKRFPTSYNMFTGPSLFKSMEKKLLIGRSKKDGHPVFRDVTLYVTYDKNRKAFKFAYNPDFILMCAIDEYSVVKGKYKSFDACYKYILAFLITHEMLHIVHHNTVATEKMVNDADIDVGDHEVANIVQDSYINCNISKAMSGADGLKSRGLAPMPRIGVGDEVKMRAEHNEGLRYFSSVEDLVNAIVEVFKKTTKCSSNTTFTIHNKSMWDSLAEVANADVIISITVSSNFTPIRGESSSLYQLFVNNVTKALVKGRVFAGMTKVSDAEKLSDLKALPIGTLVMVKGNNQDICWVTDYDENTKKYTLEYAESTGFKKIRVGTEILNVTEYGHSGKKYPRLCKRHEIKPYDPTSDAFAEGEKPKKPQNNQGGQQGQQGQQSNDGTIQAKTLNVGDIVYVRKAKKYGRITAISGGKFEIEEMENKGVKVVDQYFN